MQSGCLCKLARDNTVIREKTVLDIANLIISVSFVFAFICLCKPTCYFVSLIELLVCVAGRFAGSLSS